MKCYSLIKCSSDYYCIGIYTSLANLYIALKNNVAKVKRGWDYQDEEIKTWYEVKEIYLDTEPRKYSDFSTSGKKVKINWKKIF